MQQSAEMYKSRTRWVSSKCTCLSAGNQAVHVGKCQFTPPPLCHPSPSMEGSCLQKRNTHTQVRFCTIFSNRTLYYGLKPGQILGFFTHPPYESRLQTLQEHKPGCPANPETLAIEGQTGQHDGQAASSVVPLGPLCYMKLAGID